MAGKTPYTIRQYLRDLFHYINPYRGEFVIGAFLRFTSDVSRLYPAWAISQVVTLLAHPSNPVTGSELLKIFITWGVLTLYFSWAHNISKLFGYRVAEKASLDIYRDCLGHIFTLDLAWHEAENSGNKMKRIDKGLDGINVTIRRIFDVLIEVGVNMIGIVLIFFTLEKTLSLALVFFIIIYFLIGTALLKRSVKQERIVNQKSEDLGGITFEALNNIQTIKSLAINQGVMSTVQVYIKTLVQEIQKRIWYFQSQGVALMMFEVLFEFSVIATLAWSIWAGKHDVSLLVLFIGLFAKVSESTSELTDVTQQLALAKIWVSRAVEILQTSPEIEHPLKVARQQAYPPDWQELRIKDLKFTYKKGQTLKGISLTIKRGQKVGIVGLSGAGKSTLFRLLLNLYENYEGTVMLDQVSFKNMVRQSYIDHVAVVLQDTELFDMSLKENIEIAAVHGTTSQSELLRTVVKMAHLDEVVNRLPNKLDTVIGEKGIKLSGGQRQRLGIARALYRQPDILLLDEATSHLDVHSEKEIQKALQECLQNFTTIVVAHRLSTLKAMDKIVVLEHGVIAEEGTFEELLAKQGPFAKMWKEQKL